MTITRAVAKDIPNINRLLHQVLRVHHDGRPDLFKANSKKYTNPELKAILKDESRPVFVAFDDAGNMVGYVFCILEIYKNDNINTDRKTLYIDDFCVEALMRGRRIGTELYRYVLNYARNIGCYNVTLNVWSCNPDASAFYQAMGMKPYKIGMETIL
ncbi:MAG: GNAT family N-acetyltransferase [Oscillospiraceae bacterium]|nr:GNAT family N-acetyltransferase [Oscillospiraceae bacterium]MBR7084374.1 GNAT family N-acetyltransferase [Oscillospiraceae bacterium]